MSVKVFTSNSYNVCFLFVDMMQQKAIEGGALDIVDQYLHQYRTEEGLCNMVLVTIASLTDSGTKSILSTHYLK